MSSVDRQVESAEKAIMLDKRAESPKDAARKAKAKLQEKNEKENTCSIEMLGNPELSAGDVVELTGFGAFSGNYLVKKAVHRFAGGYTTTLDLSKCRAKEDKVTVMKSIEVTNRKDAAGKKRRLWDVRECLRAAALGVMAFERVKGFLELASFGDNALSGREQVMLCLPEIAEAMSARQEKEEDRQGWTYLAQMFRHWFSRKALAYQRSLEDESAYDPVWVDWDWVMKFQRAYRAHYEFALKLCDGAVSVEGTIISNPALNELTKMLNRDGKFTYNKETFDYISSEWQHLEKNYYTHAKIQGYDVSANRVDGLLAALEKCTLRALASGWVEPVKKDGVVVKHVVHVEKVAVFVHDVFNFDSDNYEWIGLGFWSCRDKKFAEVDLFDESYIQMRNGYFREFRKRRGQGGDFLVLSRPQVVECFKGVSYNA